MKRIQLGIALVIVILPMLGVVASASAQGFRTGNDVTVSSQESLPETLFASGRSIDIAGTIDGDVFCAGQTVDITGTVNGDVICVGQDIHIAGVVHGSIRVAGQSVSVGARVERSASLAGQSVTQESSSTVLGDVSIAGQDVQVNGEVGRDLALASTTASINGKVDRNVLAQVEQLSLDNKATVLGTVTYTSAKQLTKANGSSVSGSITRKEPTEPRHRTHYGAFVSGGLWFALYLFSALILFSLLLALLFPTLLQVASSVAIKEPLKTVLAGLVASIVVPSIIFVLLVTVIGIPIGLVLLLLWLLALALAGPLAAYYLGRLIAGTNATNPLLVMLLGSVILIVAYFIPFLGVVVSLVALWFGIGMLLLQVPRLPRPRYTFEPAPTSRRK